MVDGQRLHWSTNETLCLLDTITIEQDGGRKHEKSYSDGVNVDSSALVRRVRDSSAKGERPFRTIHSNVPCALRPNVAVIGGGRVGNGTRD